MVRILVDADACPVKEEIYRLAIRHDLDVVMVTHGPLRVPRRGRIQRVQVARGLDAADDWIADQAGPGDIVITADVPLARRCLDKGARVIAPYGQVFTPESIGDMLAHRDLLENLRQAGVVTGGPAAYAASDRTRFLSRLGEAIHALKQAEVDQSPG
ncbi:MAG TPA: YaiI/YqxD family protein [Candidatus Polarisedimenticolia bacterium]|nr:YaiI/YqxD family protein [Candidatus Polarisedimenticolia bacterium]